MDGSVVLGTTCEKTIVTHRSRIEILMSHLKAVIAISWAMKIALDDGAISFRTIWPILIAFSTPSYPTLLLLLLLLFLKILMPPSIKNIFLVIGFSLFHTSLPTYLPILYHRGGGAIMVTLNLVPIIIVVIIELPFISS